MPVNDIKFTAVFGSEIKKVDISSPNGAGGGYNLMVDDYLHGKLFKRDGIWGAFFHRSNDYTGADIEELGNIIDNANG